MAGENQDFSKSSKMMPDPGKVRQLLASPEGAALIRLLQKDGGKGLQSAAESLRRGDTEGVKAALAPLLEGTEGGVLAERLGDQL